MAQPGTTSRAVLAVIWLVVGAAMVAVPAWTGWTRGEVLLNGHPLSLAVTLLCGLAGVVALAWGVATLLLGARYEREAAEALGTTRTPAQLRRRGRWRIGVALPALVLCVLTVSVLAWSRPFPADPVALSAMRSSAGVRVADRLTWYELQPTQTNSTGREIKPTVGLVFYPGARVDPRAYASLLSPVAAAGYLVVVLKEPFGIGLIQAGHAEAPISVHPEIKSWAVGGHSLGGVAASSFADAHAPKVTGLLLLAAYPASKLHRRDLRVLSLSGSADGLATPAKVNAAKAELPTRSRYVVIKGAVHADFGNYGVQPGDGTPSISRAAAQAQIVQSTRALLASLVPRPRPVVKRR